MTHDDAKKKLILAGQVLVDEGQDDFTRGHISVRLPDDPGHFFMKPHSVGLDEITLANILTIDLAGNVVAGTARRHSEVYIHSEVYKARPDVGCVLHTHPPYAIALSASGTPLKCFSQPSALFYEALGTYDDTINLIRTPEMGTGVAQALGDGRAVLLKNHGVVVAGSSQGVGLGIAEAAARAGAEGVLLTGRDAATGAARGELRSRRPPPACVRRDQSPSRDHAGPTPPR